MSGVPTDMGIKNHGGIGMQVIISLAIYLFPLLHTARHALSRSPSVPPIPSVSRGTVWPVSVKVPPPEHHGACVCGPLVPFSPRLGLEWRGILHLPKAAAWAQENESSSANGKRPPKDDPRGPEVAAT